MQANLAKTYLQQFIHKTELNENKFIKFKYQKVVIQHQYFS